MARRLKKSKLDAEPCVEDIDFRHPRGLDRPLIRTLITSQWVAQHLSALFTGFNPGIFADDFDDDDLTAPLEWVLFPYPTVHDKICYL
jgi:hypothetical protein